jgi:hypothetical protein
MFRKGLVRAAACAALACVGWSGLARAADDVAATRDVNSGRATQPALASDLSLRPVYLDDATPAARMPLMALLDSAGLAKGLDEAKINIGGGIAGSYTYSFSKPPGDFITGRVFDVEDESPLLNQIELFVERTVDDAITKHQFDIGGRMEWRWGGDSRFIHANGLFDHYGFGDGPRNQFDLTQAFVDVAIPVGNGIKLRVGKFVTTIGYEVIEPWGNPLYSHSYLFGYAIPFTHTGVQGYYTINDQWKVNAAITRGWDQSLEDNNGSAIDFLGGVTYTFGKDNDPFSAMGGKDSQLIINLSEGPQEPGDSGNYRTLIDLQLSTKVGDNLTLALNADYAYEPNSIATAKREDAQWFGAAFYAGYKLSDAFTVNCRAEYFNDDDGARLTGAVGGAGVFEATLGLAITPFPNDAYGKNLVVRPEVRYDYASKNFFDAGTERYQFTAAIDAYYKF